MCVCHVGTGLWSSEETLGFPEAGVTGGCEPPKLGTKLRSSGRAASILHSSAIIPAPVSLGLEDWKRDAFQTGSPPGHDRGVRA